MNFIDADMFRAMIRSGAMDLQRHCDEVNDLNVFPVPDGDTGVNMFSTIRGGVEALESVKGAMLGECCKALSRGMLLAARGNSGVILSQFFAGMTAPLSILEQANVMQFAQAFEEGVKRAYEVVVKPVEGTILTVMREGGQYALEKLDSATSFEEYFTHLLFKMRSTLLATPTLLPVLKEAGVIDSGGAGLLYIIEGMAQAIGGKIIEDVSLNLVTKAIDSSDIIQGNFDERTDLDYGYCTEFILQLTKAKDGVKRFDLNHAIEYLSSLGDSLVAFLDGTLFKVHVHTKKPHEAIAFALQFGEFIRFKMENMTLQHQQTLVDKSRSIGLLANPSLQRRKTAMVAVAQNEAVADVFRMYGVDCFLLAGNLLNPGTEDFVHAFQRADAEDVIVFPNNKNEVMVAEMAAKYCETARIHIVPTQNIAEGISCASVIDLADLSVEENLSRANATLKSSKTCGIYRASRDSVCHGVSIKEGSYVYSDGEDIDNAASIAEVFNRWFARQEGEHSLVTLLYADSVPGEEKEAIRSSIDEGDDFLDVQEYDIGECAYALYCILD